MWMFLAGCTCAGREPPPGPPDGDPSGVPSDTALTSTGTTGVTGATGETAEPLAWVMLDGSTDESCGLLNDGRAVCWGYPEWVDQTPTTRFVQISYGLWGACGLEPEGTVSCWCVNPSEQGPCTGVPQGDDFIEVQQGAFWACAETSEHRLHCWGYRPYVVATPTEPVLAWSIEVNVGGAVLPTSG